MTNFQDVFCRVEKKYMLSEEQALRLADGLRARGMRQDDYGRHTISNIYYDTPDFELIRRSLEKPVYKEKLRLRAYGAPQADGDAFVEIKKKLKGVVYKRRILLPLGEAARCLARGFMPEDAGQIGREIDYFLRFWKPEPKAMLAYDRDAFYSAERADLRVTFDRAIRYRMNDLDLRRGAYGERLLPDGLCLMEVKLGEAMPLWLPRLLTACGARPASFSKYGEAYRAEVNQEKEWKQSA